MTIRTLIIDDEPVARKKIRHFLDSEGDFEVVGECGTGEDAIAGIEKARPDLVFLDVQMPEGDGLEVIEAVGAENMPITVFVTAYDRYAVKAFDFHAVDYLLKPFDRSRFRKALEQIRAQVEQREKTRLNRRLLALIEDLRGGERYTERLTVKTTSGVAFVNTEEIDWIDAAGNYVRINTREGDSHLLRETMSSLEERLDPKRFVRIHRSTIVNLDRIREIRPRTHREHLVIMQQGKRLTLSRSYKDRLQEILS